MKWSVDASLEAVTIVAILSFRDLKQTNLVALSLSWQGSQVFATLAQNRLATIVILTF